MSLVNKSLSALVLAPLLPFIGLAMLFNWLFDKYCEVTDWAWDQWEQK